MIDFTDRHTLVTIKDALRRALNSLDHEIAVVNFGVGLSTNQKVTKLAILDASRDDMRAIYDQIDGAVNFATWRGK